MEERFYEEIMVEDDHGQAEGYVASTQGEHVQNWLEERGCLHLIPLVCKYNRVSILSSIYVDEEHRGRGMGSSLLEEFLEEAGLCGAEAVLLEADTVNNSFDLVRWYERYGFQVVYPHKDYPVMLLEFGELNLSTE